MVDTYDIKDMGPIERYNGHNPNTRHAKIVRTLAEMEIGQSFIVDNSADRKLALTIAARTGYIVRSALLKDGTYQIYLASYNKQMIDRGIRDKR